MATPSGAALYDVYESVTAVQKSDVRGSAEAVLKTLADGLRDRDPSLTRETAFVKAAEENPRLAGFAVHGC